MNGCGDKRGERKKRTGILLTQWKKKKDRRTSIFISWVSISKYHRQEGSKEQSFFASQFLRLKI
jgi:hypothetical protein